MRCIHRDVDSGAVKRKTVDSVRGLELVIDGYNVILTIASAIEHLPIFLCDDGFVRDLRSSYRKDFEAPSVREAIVYMVKALELVGASNPLIILDKNVSWSAEHAELLRSEFDVRAITATKADIAVIGSGKVVSSSDFVILLRSEKVFDLAQFILRSAVRDVKLLELFPQ